MMDMRYIKLNCSNGRISELCQQTRFKSAAELEQSLKDYLMAYNHFIPQRAIGHQSPIDAIASWYAQHPEMFVRQVYKQTERDNYVSPCVSSGWFAPDCEGGDS
jgi:hypothetical protein